MPRVRVIAGTARSDRAARIVALLAEDPDRSLLIVPTEQHAQLRTDSLLRAAGRAAFLDPPIVSFEGLVRRILRGAPLEHARIDALGQHLLLKRAVERVTATRALDTIGAAARTEGFLDHLLSVIGQLKQAAIEPEDFAQRMKKARRKNDMDGIVSAVYREYQNELHRADAVDLQGMYWLARNVCEESCPAALQAIEHLLLDEFDDFTPSEFRVIQEAARHVEQLTFGFNVSLGPAQQDLYAIPRETYERIGATFTDVEVDSRDEPAPTSVTEYVASTLLARDAVPAPKTMRSDLDLVECHTVDHEIESLARRIKRLIREDGVAPREIALVYRNPAAVRETIADVFAEFRVPLAAFTPPAAGRSALAGFLLRFTDAAQTWAEPDVADVLTSPWFAGPGAPHANAFTTLIRAARPRAARASWERALSWLASAIARPQGREMNDLVRHMPGAAPACTALLEAFAKFGKLAAVWSDARNTAGFAACLDALLDDLPIDDAIAAAPSESHREFEAAALEGIRRGLFHLHETDSAGGRPRISPADFTALFRRMLSLLTVRGSSNSGGVACIDMESARYLAFDHVFLAGVTDANVPEGHAVNALYGEDERGELRALGLPLEGAAQHDRREMLLFQRMFATARKRLTISWHTVERGGKPTQRSLYLEEILERLSDPDIEQPGRPADVLVPPLELVACERDLKNIAFLDGTTREAAKRFPHIASAAVVESDRQSASPFGAHDGVLSSDANLKFIASEFGPDAVFSATSLEQYASCPFRFFEERLLRLFAVETTAQTLDKRVEGSVIHRALELFHRDHAGKSVPDIPVDVARDAMASALEQAFTETTRGQMHLSHGLLAAEKAKLSRVLQQYLAIARDAGDSEWKPADFETVFGGSREGESGFPPYRLALDDGSVLLRGRIDRIDERAGEIRLVDYKSSEVSAGDITSGRTFQLALYALAAESVVRPRARCDSAVYLAVGRHKGYRYALSRGEDSSDWDRRVEIARDAVSKALAGIRAGVFHPTTDENPCKGCPDEKVCRFQRARMQRKAGA